MVFCLWVAFGFWLLEFSFLLFWVLWVWLVFVVLVFVRWLIQQVSFLDQVQLRMQVLLLFLYGLFLLKSCGELQLQPLASATSEVHGSQVCPLLYAVIYSIFL